MKLIFFGSSEFSVYILDELLAHKIIPELIVTMPDKPKGRKLVLTPTSVKVWAQNHNIEVTDSGREIISKFSASSAGKLTPSSDLFLVASYGKMIPKEIFEMPKYKTLNIHPSLLPKYRGASPIQNQILNDEKDIGVTIMQIEETMDAGPIVAQRKMEGISKLAAGGIHWPLGRKELEKTLATEGAKLFAEILPAWIAGEIKIKRQDESKATYCSKVKKEDGQINLKDDPYKNLLKIKAFEEWPTAYFFVEKNEKKMRVIITDARLKTDGSLEILKVIPEGKKEMGYENFWRGKK